MPETSVSPPCGNASEDTYRTLFDSLLNGVAYCQMVDDGDGSMDFRFLRVNEAFARQTGLDDVTGRLASEAVPDIRDVDAELLAIFGRVAASGQSERFEYHSTKRDAWLSISAYCPHPGHFVVVFDVISERKRAEAALLESESRLKRVIEGSDQGFWDWNLRTQTFKVSPRLEAILGYTPGEMGDSLDKWAEYIHPNDLDKTLASIDRHLAGQSPVHEVEIRCRNRSGGWNWILVRGRIVEHAADGRPAMMSGTFTDITARKQAERELRQAATVFKNTQEGVMITDAESRILSVNHAFTLITGYTETEVRGKNPDLLHSSRHSAEFFSDIENCLRTSGFWQGELWNRRKNGDLYPQLTTINVVPNDRDEVAHYVTVFTDVSTIRASQQRLEFLARHDPLTHLPNRPMLFSRLEGAMRSAQRSRSLSALLLIDLDRFKDVNDSFGHLIGDSLLQQVAQRLTARQRDNEMLARLGGDEFALWLEEIARPEDAGRVADEIIALLDKPWFLPNDAEVRLAGSVGIALYPGPASTPEELLQQADAAMYRAKKEGRARYQFFSSDLTENARRRIAMESQLRHAIDNNEMELHFQPQLDSRSGRIVGAEALVRWHPPKGGLIAPDHFVPLAEETGLILALGRWVLRETCRIGRGWIDTGHSPHKLAVNVSARQLHDPGFAEEVLTILADTGFPAERLEIEMTESSLMPGRDAIIQQLHTLRARGIQIAIDDFGTGYSSLAYLKRFPLDVLKIDRSFVENLAQRKDDREIITAIIQMGHTLGFRVVAEGVETAEQLAYLKEKGCDVYQGDLFSAPLPQAGFEALIAPSHEQSPARSLATRM